MKNQLIQNACKTVMIFCRHHRSTILSCISAAGVVATGILSARGGIKAEKILEQENDYIWDEDNPIEGVDCLKDVIPVAKWRKAVKLIPVLLPPLLTGAGTIALIFLNDAQNRQAQAALAGAYALMAKKLADYKAEVKDIFSEGGEKTVSESLALKRLEGNEIIREEHAENAKLWYDSFSERYFWATDAEVSDAEFFINRLFRMQGYAMLNDFYRLLHLNEIPEGDELGWEEYIGETQYGYTWIDFQHIDRAGDETTTSYTELFMDFGPHPFFDEIAEMEAEYSRVCSSIRKEKEDDHN